MKESLEIALFFFITGKSIDGGMNKLRTLPECSNFSRDSKHLSDIECFFEILHTAEKHKLNRSRFIFQDHHESLLWRSADDIECANGSDHSKPFSGIDMLFQIADLLHVSQIDIIERKIIEKIVNGRHFAFAE